MIPIYFKIPAIHAYKDSIWGFTGSDCSKCGSTCSSPTSLCNTGTTLPHSHADTPVRFNPGELDISLLREKRMILQLGAYVGQRDRFHIFYKYYKMGITHTHKCTAIGYTVDLEILVQQTAIYCRYLPGVAERRDTHIYSNTLNPVTRNMQHEPFDS